MKSQFYRLVFGNRLNYNYQKPRFFLVPTRRRGNAFSTCQRRGAASPQKRDAGASQIGSHAGAWEPEKPENMIWMINGMPMHTTFAHPTWLKRWLQKSLYPPYAPMPLS
jgi:hypothetical protein